MDIIQILLWWSLLGIIPYQILVLRPWIKTHFDELWLSDIIKSLPFGLIVIGAMVLIVALNTGTIKRR